MVDQSTSYEPLLDEPREDDDLSWTGAGKSTAGRLSCKSRWWRAIRPFFYHGCVFLVYTLIFLAVLVKVPPSQCDSALIFSPAREALSYESRVFVMRRDKDKMGPYFGTPSPELDLAWHNLLKYQNIHISLDELRHFEGREHETIQYPDGSGYMAQLQVYHDLHCLKRIHRTMWPEYYYPNLTAAERDDLKFHNDHCLDTLRQSIMCHPDISLLTMRWGHRQPIPIGNFSAPHECVAWPRLDAWSEARTVDVMRPGFMIHPTLGPSFPDGKGVRTGVEHDS